MTRENTEYDLEKGISPIIGVVLFIVITISLSGVMGFVFLNIDSPSNNARAAVDLTETNSGVEVLLSDTGNIEQVRVKADSTTIGELQNTGDRISFRVPKGTKVSAIGVTDDGERTVLDSLSIDTSTSTDSIQITDYSASDASTVSGTVQVNPPISDAEVISVTNSGVKIESVLTDNNGNFSITAQEEGQLIVNIEGSTDATGASGVSNPLYASKVVTTSSVQSSPTITIDTSSIQTVTHDGSQIDVVYDTDSNGNKLVTNPWQASVAVEDSSSTTYKLATDVTIRRDEFTQEHTVADMQERIQTNKYNIQVISPELSITWLDLGLGDSVLLESETGDTMLIDTGDFRDSGEKVKQKLNQRNISTIDYLVATHPDADHIGGHAEIINSSEIMINSVYDNGETATTTVYTDYIDAVNSQGLSINTLSKGDTIPFNGAKITVLHPSNTSGSENNNSIVLLVQNNGNSYILPGDIESEAESTIVSEYSSNRLNSHTLHIPHNGSSSSSTTSFISAVDPKYGVITSNLDNQFGHPADSVVNRLELNNVDLYWTALNGDITLTSTTSGPKISAEDGSLNDVTKNPSYDVTINSVTDNPAANSIIDVEYTVTNNGNRTDIQDITLSAAGNERDETEDIKLESGSSSSGSLEWNTTGQTGEYTLTISSDDDSTSETIQIGSGSLSNILLNSSFESGSGEDADNWTEDDTWSSGRTETRANKGSYSLLMDRLTGSYSGRTLESEKVSVTSNKTYTIDADYYLENNGGTDPANYRYALRIKWIDSSGSEIKTSSDFSSFSSFDTWKSVSYSAQAPSDATKAKVIIEAKEDSNNDLSVYWDPVTLQEPN